LNGGPGVNLTWRRERVELSLFRGCVCFVRCFPSPKVDAILLFFAEETGRACFPPDPPLTSFLCARRPPKRCVCPSEGPSSSLDPHASLFPCLCFLVPTPGGAPSVAPPFFSFFFPHKPRSSLNPPLLKTSVPLPPAVHYIFSLLYSSATP